LLALPPAKPQFADIVHEARVMEEVLRRASYVAEHECRVLIQGESGTGKELLAQAIHRASIRSEGAFEAVNCGAFAPGLAASEIFGHEKGAFTGASKQRRGRFELAHNGTLFLDEITEMPRDVQVLLLRAIQEGSFTRVGGEEPVKVDVRIIAATNRNLANCMHTGSFREDLYWRVAEYIISIPPLRDRIEDIPLIARHLLGILNDSWGSREGYIKKDLSATAIRRLCEHNWPGNVRELNGVLVRAGIESAGSATIHERHIEHAIQIGGGSILKSPTAISLQQKDSLGKILTSFERQHLEKALSAAGGVKAQAARLLGLSCQTFGNHLKRHGLQTVTHSRRRRGLSKIKK